MRTGRSCNYTTLSSPFPPSSLSHRCCCNNNAAVSRHRECGVLLLCCKCRAVVSTRGLVAWASRWGWEWVGAVPSVTATDACAHGRKRAQSSAIQRAYTPSRSCITLPSLRSVLHGLASLGCSPLRRAPLSAYSVELYASEKPRAQWSCVCVCVCTKRFASLP